MNNFNKIAHINKSNFFLVKGLGNKEYFYSNGYFLLWSYDKTFNFFPVNSKLWVIEEEKRKFFFRYWLKVPNPFSVNSKEWNDEVKIRKLDSLKRLQIDLKNYSFYITILFNFLKMQTQRGVSLSPFFFQLFQKETDYILSQKEYKDSFLKQNILLLKRFDSLKKYINFEKILLKEKANLNEDSFLIYYNKNQSEVFPYLYMLPSFSNNDLVEDADSKTFFLKKIILNYFSLTKIETWFSTLLFGVKDFWSFLKIKFFYFNFSNFLQKLLKNKIFLNAFFQNKINEKLLEDEKFYLLSINQNIDPEGLEYLSDYNLWHYLYKDALTEVVDENFLFNDFLEFYDIAFFYEVEKKHLNFFYKNFKSLIFLENQLFLFFKNNFKDVSSFYIFKFFKMRSGFNIFYVSEILLKERLFLILEDSYFFNKFEIEYVNEVLKNVYYNPSFVRTFLIEKTTNIKSRGLIKLYNSYIIFLKKYFYCNFLVNTNVIFSNFFFKKYKTRQKIYDFYKSYSGEINTAWCFFPSQNVFLEDYTDLFNEYLKLSFIKDEVKNEKNKYFMFRTSSAGFFKYSVDLFYKLNETQETFSLKDQTSFFNGQFLYLTMLLNLIKIKNNIIIK